MKKNFLFLFFVFWLSFPAFSCDTSLISLLIGESPDSEFFQELKRISVTNMNFGTNALNSRVPEKDMDILMEAWLEFEQKYRYSPPEWAKKDKEWHTKFSSVAKMIGELRKGIKNNDFNALHQKSLLLSRRLNIFLSGYKEVGYKKHLIIMPLIFEDLISAFEQKDRGKLILASDKLLKTADNIVANVATDTKGIFDQFHRYAVSIQKVANAKFEEKELFSWKFKMLLDSLESEYSMMNRKLLRHENSRK